MVELKLDSSHLAVLPTPAVEEEKHEASSIVPNTHYLENIVGLSNRIEAVILEHFGSELPVIHFTNAEVGDKIDDLVSTGFLERFSDKGAVNRIHVGSFKRQNEIRGAFRDMFIGTDSLFSVLQKLRKITEQFYHHGLRTNKNQLKDHRNAAFSLPAAIIMEKPAQLSRGTDNYDHWITRDSLGKEKILAVIKFNPRRATKWVTLTRNEENTVLKQILHKLGKQRLDKIFHTYEAEQDTQKKNDLVLYAHDLVDAYLVSRDEFDDLFKNIPDSLRGVILGRRQKYRLFSASSEGYNKP